MCDAERADAQVFADEAEIKKAYRALALQHHPDKNQGNEEEAKAAFQRVGASYERLKVPEGESSDSDMDVEFDMDDAMNMFREMCARAPRGPLPAPLLRGCLHKRACRVPAFCASVQAS